MNWEISNYIALFALLLSIFSFMYSRSANNKALKMKNRELIRNNQLLYRDKLQELSYYIAQGQVLQLRSNYMDRELEKTIDGISVEARKHRIVKAIITFIEEGDRLAQEEKDSHEEMDKYLGTAWEIEEPDEDMIKKLQKLAIAIKSINVQREGRITQLEKRSEEIKSIIERVEA